MKPFYRPTWAEINLDALTYNIEALQAIHQSTLIAVIKANAYGHGDVKVAKHLESIGIKFFAVATLDEALNLRLHKIQSDILVMGVIHPDDLHLVKSNQLICSALTSQWIETCPSSLDGLRIHLKVNTGLNRYGLEPQDVPKALKDLASKGANVEGIFTHFASSDTPSSPQTQEQYTRFETCLNSLNQSFKWIHASNSGAAVNFKTPLCNAVRIGLSLYGYSDYPIELKPVMRLYSTLQEVKWVKAHQPIGYNASYTTTQDEWIGTLCIGYADGLFRQLQGSYASIEGKACTYVGRISMDLTLVQLDQIYPIGTVVEILGPHINIHQIAKHVGTIPYELLAMITDRVPRVYKLKGETVGVLNARFPSPKLVE